MKRSPWDVHVLRAWIGKIIPAHRHDVRYQAQITEFETRGLHLIITYQWMAWLGTDGQWRQIAPDDTDIPHPFAVITEWQLYEMTEDNFLFKPAKVGHA